MNQKLDSEQLMTRYLLGELTEEEQLLLEERFFTDNEYYQQLLALEDELRYDYAQGGLTAQQRVRFERRFLVSPEERRKVELAGSVLGKLAEATNSQAPQRVLVSPKSGSSWQPLLAFFSLSNPAMQFSLAAAAVLLILGGVWLTFENSRLRTETERLQAAGMRERHASEQQIAEERARQEQLRVELDRERQARAQLEQELAMQQTPGKQSQADSSRERSIGFSFLLMPGLARDIEGPKRLSIPPGADWIRLQLHLKSRGEYRSYRAEVRKETPTGLELWNQDLSRVAAGRAVLSLPARLLTTGDYVVILKARTTRGVIEEIDEYYFNVVRQ